MPQTSLELIVQIINDLPLEQRVCVFYQYHDKLTTARIAEKLAVSDDEVKARIEAAEVIIREELAKREEDEEERNKFLIIPLGTLLIPALKYGVESGLLTINASATTTATGTGATTTTISTKAIGGIVAGVVVICGIVAGVVLFGGDDTLIEPESDGSDRTTSTTEGENNNFNEEDLVWLVEPTLEYEKVWYSPIEDVFVIGREEIDIGFTSYGAEIIDETTGEIIGTHGEDGFTPASVTRWVYDSERQLIGIYADANHGVSDIDIHPISEFAERFPDYVDNAIVVYEVDSSMRETFQDEMTGTEWEHFSGEAFSENVAVAYNGLLVTDFIFNTGGNIYNNSHTYATEPFSSALRGKQIPSFALLYQGDKRGIIDKNGDVLVPFVFEDIMIIDESSAFAKYNGMYGIISIPE
jgi:hypothetical protein